MQVRGQVGKVGAHGKLIAISTSAQTGSRKSPIPVGVVRENHGLVGDAHAGSQREVSLLAWESIEKMRAQGFSVGPGDFAENLTISGIVLHNLAPGARIRIGEAALLELTQIGKACHSDCEIRRLTGECVMPSEGVFAKVLIGGEVRPGDRVDVVGEAGEGCHPDS